jgi:hypothetical protein
LPQALFSIKFKDASLANACMGNELIISEVTYNNEQRSAIAPVQLDKYDVTPTPLTI